MSSKTYCGEDDLKNIQVSLSRLSLPSAERDQLIQDVYFGKQPFKRLKVETWPDWEEQIVSDYRLSYLFLNADSTSWEIHHYISKEIFPKDIALEKNFTIVKGLLFEFGWGNFDGVQDKPNIPEAIKCYLEAAELGDPNGYYILGTLFNFGWSNPDGSQQKPNKLKATDYYFQAAKGGRVDVFNILGDRYRTGWSNPDGSQQAPNMPKAIDFYLQGAKLGDTKPPCQLGRLFQSGWSNLDGSRQVSDYQIAFSYFFKTKNTEDLLPYFFDKSDTISIAYKDSANKTKVSSEDLEQSLENILASLNHSLVLLTEEEMTDEEPPFIVYSDEKIPYWYSAIAYYGYHQKRIQRLFQTKEYDSSDKEALVKEMEFYTQAFNVLHDLAELLRTVILEPENFIELSSDHPSTIHLRKEGKLPINTKEAHNFSSENEVLLFEGPQNSLRITFGSDYIQTAYNFEQALNGLDNLVQHYQQENERARLKASYFITLQKEIQELIQQSQSYKREKACEQPRFMSSSHVKYKHLSIAQVLYRNELF